MSRKMKDSGVKWIGEIPSHWEVRKLKSIAKRITDYVASGSFASLNKNVTYLDEPDYAMLVRTVDLSKKTNKKPIYINKHAYDFLSNSNLFGGELILPNIGSVGSVYYFEPMYKRSSLAPNAILVDMKGINKFFYYLFLSPLVSNALKHLGNDAVQEKFNKTQLRQFKVINPPIEEQQKIANFLDEKVSQIDTIIEKTKQSIEELKKYKQALITETVTKGLDPNVEMKDSGIEWVGEIPKHWEIRRLRDISIITRGTVDKSKEKNEIPVYLVQYTNVYYKREQKINDDDYLPITVSENEYKKYKVRKGDILLTASSETKDDIGHSTVIVEDLPNHVFGSDIIRIRIPNKIVDLNYKKYFMENYYYLAKFDKLSRGITRFRFGMDQFKSLKYVIPPIEEQVKIAKYLDNITNHINQLICNKEKLINELESYKKSLIYEYVTGKKEHSC